MCDKCIDTEKKEIIDEQEDQAFELSSDERFAEFTIEQEIIRMAKEIEIDTTDINNNPEFYKGVQEGLLLAGLYSSLVACGVSSKMAEELTMNSQTCAHNARLQTAINENQLELSKNQINQAQNQQL